MNTDEQTISFESSVDRLVEKLLNWVDVVIFNLPNLIIAVIAFLISYWLSRNIPNFINKFLRKFIKQASIRNLIANIVSVSLISLGLILAMAILNLDKVLTSILAGAGVAGLAVGLALQGALANTFSGIFLAIKDELNIGDWVETNGYSGKVIDIDLRNTKIKEADNNIVVLPNKMILENPFKNYGLTSRIRCTIQCGVDYSSDLEEVKKIAVSTVEAIYPPNPLEEIEFYYEEFGDSSINFILRFWVDAQEKLTALDVKSNAIIELKKAFDKAGINIPFPVRQLIQ